MSKFLINESPLVFQPTLAAFIGLSEAIVLQQVQYWISNPKAGVFKDGFKWVYNSYENWQIENFPFWSVDGVKKIFLRLESLGVLISAQLSSDKWDKTKYYRIDYEKLEEVLSPSGSKNPIEGVPSTQSTITETTSETTNTPDSEKTPLSVSDLSVEWQIAAGVEEVTLHDERARQMMDSAKLIGTGMGEHHIKAAAIALAFMQERDIILPFEVAKKQRSAIKEMIGYGVNADHVREAVQKLMSSKEKLTITDLHSVKKTAADIANQSTQTEHAFLEIKGG